MFGNYFLYFFFLFKKKITCSKSNKRFLSQKNSENQNFYESYDLYSSELGENKKLIFDVCLGFLIRNGYYFVALMHQNSSDSLDLYVSGDGNSFSKVFFPANDILSEYRYTILDTINGIFFLFFLFSNLEKPFNLSGSSFINVDHSTTNDGFQIFIIFLSKKKKNSFFLKKTCK